MKVRVSKKVSLPKKPVTKRDKHMYDLGAKQQAEVFANNYGHLDGEIMATSPSPRKEILNDYQPPIGNNDTVYKVILGVLWFVVFLLALHEVVMWMLG